MGNAFVSLRRNQDFYAVVHGCTYMFFSLLWFRTCLNAAVFFYGFSCFTSLFFQTFRRMQVEKMNNFLSTEDRAKYSRLVKDGAKYPRLVKDGLKDGLKDKMKVIFINSY